MKLKLIQSPSVLVKYMSVLQKRKTTSVVILLNLLTFCCCFLVSLYVPKSTELIDKSCTLRVVSSVAKLMYLTQPINMLPNCSV